MALLVVGGAVTSCNCGTRPSILLILPIEFPLDFSLDIPKINFSFGLQLPSLDLDLTLDLAFDLAFDLSLDLSLDFSFEFPSISFDLNLDLSLPTLDLDLDLSLPSLDLDLSIPDLDFSLPKLDLDLDLPIPSFDFNLDFTFSIDISGGFVIDMPMATIKNHIPYLNVLPFGMCTSGGNPAVAAALGAPQPCTPITPSPWDPGATTVLIQGVPALDSASTLPCNFGGTIKIVFPGQTSVFVP